MTSALLYFNAGLLYDNQLCSDKTFLMKWCVSLLFMNNLFYDLNPSANSLAGEIFPLQTILYTDSLGTQFKTMRFLILPLLEYD